MYADDTAEEIDGSLVELQQRDEIVRKVIQVFCLERLAAGDTITAKNLLANMVAVSFLNQIFFVFIKFWIIWVLANL